MSATPFDPHILPQARHFPTPSSKSLRTYLTKPISLRHVAIPLFVCCFGTGLIDSGTFIVWGTFMGMQTGNTVFLALLTASLPVDAPHLSWLRALVAIVSFMLGAYLSSRLLRYFGLTRRLTLFLNFFMQGLSVFVAAILVTTDAIPPPERNVASQRILIGIPFLAGQFGAQVATAKGLGIVEVPTTMVSNVYSDLISDENWLKRDNIKRDRRVGAAISFALGGICGAWLVRANGGVGPVLWVGGAIKMGLAFCWLGFPSAGGNDGDGTA